MNTTKNRESKLSKAPKVPFYDLELVRFLIKDGSGLDIAYAYEDLVFSEHGIFILQFIGESSQNFDCWFNKDCKENDRINILKSLMKSANLNGFEISYKGNFTMSQKEDSEEIDLHFEKIYFIGKV